MTSPDIGFEGPVFSERSWGIFLAVAFHAALFLAGSVAWTHKADYGMDASSGTAEVDLVAAPAPMETPTAAPISVHQEQAHAVPPIMDKEDVSTPDKSKAPTAALSAAPVPNALLRTANLNGPLGDGSSPVPGTDATTIHHAGSSGSYFKPGYYRNPPPPYPAEARKLKQEGRVLLEVQVTAEGRVGSLSVKQSSGFPLLDQAALQGVQNWRFRPATAGGLRMESVVEIPIRFQLK